MIIGNSYILGIYTLSKYNFFKGKTIGKGTFGKVKLGVHIITNE